MCNEEHVFKWQNFMPCYIHLCEYYVKNLYDIKDNTVIYVLCEVDVFFKYFCICVSLHVCVCLCVYDSHSMQHACLYVRVFVLFIMVNIYHFCCTCMALASIIISSHSFYLTHVIHMKVYLISHLFSCSVSQSHKPTALWRHQNEFWSYNLQRLSKFHNKITMRHQMTRTKNEVAVQVESSLLEAVFFPLIKQVCLGASQIHNLRASISLSTENSCNHYYVYSNKLYNEMNLSGTKIVFTYGYSKCGWLINWLL